MKLKRLTPELMVEDVKKTVDFYVNVLGFKLTNKVGEGQLIWANVKWGDGGVELMFISREGVTEDVKEFMDKEAGGSVILYIEVEGIEELYEKVKNKEKIVRDLHQTFYGSKEFAMKDLNGYVLMFGEREEK